VNGKATKKELN